MEDLTDEYIGDLCSNYRVDTREEKLKLPLERFKSSLNKDGIEIEYIKDPAYAISVIYFHFMTTYIKDYIDDKADEHKIASGLESTINYMQPIIKASGGVSIRTLNAKLSIYVAKGLISTYSEIGTDFLNTGIETLQDSIVKNLKNRVLLLANQNLDNCMPILLNSQYWEAMFLMYHHQKSASMR